MTSPVRIFFACAFIATWGIGLAGLIAARIVPGLPAFSTVSPFYWAAGYATSLVGVAMTAICDGRSGLARLSDRLLPWHAGLHWYLIVFSGYTAITVGAYQGSRWLGVDTPSMPSLWPLLTGPAVTLWTDVGPVGEEFGWRGFALPRLLERWPPLVASILLGCIHTVWHLPLFFIGSMPQARLSLPMFAVGVISIAIMDTWLYLRTDANLLLAIIVHLLANYCGGLFSPSALPLFFGAEGLAALAIVVSGGMHMPRDTRCHRPLPIA